MVYHAGQKYKNVGYFSAIEELSLAKKKPHPLSPYPKGEGACTPKT